MATDNKRRNWPACARRGCGQVRGRHDLPINAAKLARAIDYMSVPSWPALSMPIRWRPNPKRSNLSRSAGEAPFHQNLAVSAKRVRAIVSHFE